MLRIENLSRPGLKPVNLTVETGEVVAITGRSGAGKSILLRAIADLDPSDGSVTLNGKSREAFAPSVWRRDVAYVPAESGWWAEDVGSHFESIETVPGYLSRLGFPTDATSWQVSRLSTGERQRLALLRAMMVGPKVMLLDEPTSALDPEAAAKVEGVLHEKQQAGASLIIVTHDANQARRLADRAFRMEQGELHEMAAG